MQGFEDSTNPVMLLLETTSDLGAGPFTIDGAKAQFSDAGIRADVNGTRHFVPMRYVRRIWQDQVPPPAAQQPVQLPPQANPNAPDAPGPP